MAKQVYTNIFDLDYYSGSQCFLYIGDVWIDEITGLQYQTQQIKTPIYGYASQLWDDCAAGHVLVSGSFSINYKEQGYLWAVLRRYKNISGSEAGVTAKYDHRLLSTHPGARRDQPELTRNGTRVGRNGNRINRQSIERIAQGELTRGERFKFWHHLSGYSTFRTNNPRDKVFEDIAEAFEDEVWNPKATNKNLNSQIRRTDDNSFDGFDMYVVFGNYSEPKANHTVQKIIDVRLTNQAKTVTLDGKPVQEVYMFIARTVA